jgi:hypothetical protein
MTTPAPGCKPKANQAAKEERGTIFLGGPANLKWAEGPVTGQNATPGGSYQCIARFIEETVRHPEQARQTHQISYHQKDTCLAVL